ncbi:ATP-binding protein [Streptomyces griseomycini]|uniref:DNA-binding SARP family transcriptional activator n=1 Tax=Streptomyces griseomycini TaxID=66895 RepID=A0A7W7PQK7_9ACTN|nr:BTAD domain-containing putative transcriptional regulator [Streptomyces griseomycini]MBB4898697.1 DNA-binding SARP family transcriptional activator [Streptomyces griseomycini]
MREVVVRVLGRFRMGPAGGPPWRPASARAESLLGYLVLHRDEPQPRGRLAGLLWPESSEAQARTNLRHLLHTLRGAVPDVDHVLEVTARTVAWRADAACALDVTAFESALERARALPAGRRAPALAEAVAAYTGELLADCDDAWVVPERERLRAEFTDALEELAALAHRSGDHRAAVGHLERLVQEDPVRESAHRGLMRVHAALGDRARAVRAYHACVAVLERELGVAPSPQTRAAYAALLSAPRPAPSVPSAAPPDRPAPPGDPELVGRTAQRRRLTEAWRTARTGRPELVLLTGDPGIGKTRLAEDFAARVARRGAVTATARAYAAEGRLAYAPVAAWLRTPALRAAVDRLDAGLRDELSRLLPELTATGPPELLPPDEQRQRLFGAVARAVDAVGRPVLLLADDLHRFDGESLRLLHFLVRGAPRERGGPAGGRLLVVGTARPEETDPGHPLHEVLGGLRALGRCTELELGPLTRRETAALVRRLTGTEAGTDRLHADSEGNPLFLVEALRAGGQAHGGLTPRVQAVIGARLAQLSVGTAGLLGVAATIGREFTADVLGAAAGADEPVLIAGLDELWRRRIVREHGLDAYDFTHEKIREVAYAALSPALRRHHHRRVAEALARSGEATPDEVCGQIADHYRRAGDPLAAVPWALRAADAACRLHADSQAIDLLDRTLRLLREQPPSPRRDRLELGLLAALPALLGRVEGYASTTLTAVHTRALELSARLGTELAPPLVRSLALASTVGSDFAATRRYGERLLARGRESGDDVLVVEGAYVLGIAAFWQARFTTARENFELAVRHYRPERRALHLLRYAQDPRAVCLSRLANTLWFLGRPAAEAIAVRDAALAYADETGHAFTRIVARVFAGLLALDMGDEEGLREHVRELRGLGRGSPAPHAWMPLEALSGYVDVLDGHAERGIRRCRRVIAALPGVQPAPGMRAVLHRVLLAAAEAAGDTEEARRAAERLLEMGGAAAVWRKEALRARERLRDADSAREGPVGEGTVRVGELPGSGPVRAGSAEGAVGGRPGAGGG